ncbi:MAG TPA: aldehyde ferredoxin oxidoreductase family protein [Clostridia bacterium]|nr:aldehyde ferredoxin oxidoreductase family protein [Clostridia bacterium]
MPMGYCGKILHVNLSTGEFHIEEPDEKFYRLYLGGSCMGSYYVSKLMKPGVDAFDPENVLVFATSPVIGAPISGASRFNVTAKSPLTGGMGDSQAGGYWGPELKMAGFDALVITGRAPAPVYLYVNDGEYRLVDGSHLWGKTTGEAWQMIRDELADDKVRIVLIGQAGENLVRFACITNELKHFAGRNGMGAVMGSKNLKAVAVRGTQRLEFHDPEKIKELAKYGIKQIKENPMVAGLQEFGTAGGVFFTHMSGALPTRNWQTGVFEKAADISAEKMNETVLISNGTCRGCAVRCKRVVGAEKPYKIDPMYGGPEYESVGALGSLLEVGDLPGVCKANELCNKYGLDTISAGGTIAFAMECFENGIITPEDTDGIELNFGNVDALLKMIEMISFRKGIGDLLAEGSGRASRKLGSDAEKYAIQTKNQEFPMHMPRAKASLALAYACVPFGADHESSAQDPGIVAEPLGENIKGLGLSETADMHVLNFEKVKLWTYSQRIYGLLDTLDLCHFCFGYYPPVFEINHIYELLNAVTGWQTNMWELMLVGERRINLMRSFNYREGFSEKDDILPERLFEPLPEGPTAGQKIVREEFFRAREEYYRMAGWDPKTGRPSLIKLKELGLHWIEEIPDSAG